MVEFLKSHYSLTGDWEIYNKIKQLAGIELKKGSGGNYQFKLVDNQCCFLRIYQGEVGLLGQTFTETLTSQEIKDNPC